MTEEPVEATEQEGPKEPKFRINIKRNLKGQTSGEYTVRADTFTELKDTLADARGVFLDELEKAKGVEVN